MFAWAPTRDSRETKLTVSRGTRNFEAGNSLNLDVTAVNNRVTVRVIVHFYPLN